ncbi:heparinase [Meridianimarinicoccus roseus]|uniref:Heparinase n=1 Tax=Meridianimarinicoccus roseus TaxID=2072018 RepID=A0A2V2LDG6_9RHOB|nr:heparinase II/III family protein [Meridianimarinicoccus roseus]PWR01831.1 heparinase [Meridianimarinicoccus roseus]
MTGSFGAGLHPVTWRDRWSARSAGASARRARLAVPPPPPVTGDAARGAALVAGQVSLGHSRSVAAEGRSIWALTAPTRAFEAARQGFGWLDDLAALGTAPARDAARAWVAEWFTAQGHGKGPGWSLPLVAARLDRLVAHAGWLTSGSEGLPAARLERALARHRRVALARFAALPHGPEGLAVAARLVGAAARLDGSDPLLARAQDALDRGARVVIDEAGGVVDRAPETLAEAVCHLAEAAHALAEAGLGPHPEHARALARAAPVLRALRHADGGLARFHGGGAGDRARIDAALAILRAAGIGAGSGAGARHRAPPDQPMGFVRLARGRVTVIADMAAPPVAPEAATSAHAGTLGFEMTVGAAPLIVSCGTGAAFGPDWQDAARQTASHSTLVLDGQSSSRLERGRGAALVLTAAPGNVRADLHPDAPDLHVVGAHDGYGPAYGLVHARRLDLSLPGDVLEGEDMLSAATATEQRRFAAVGGGQGLPFVLRFHLHPQVEATLDPSNGAVRLTLPTRDVWHFSHDGRCTIRLDPGVYLEKTRPEPAPCRQIVLVGRAAQPVTSVRWRLTRDRATPAFAPPDTGRD